MVVHCSRSGKGVGKGKGRVYHTAVEIRRWITKTSLGYAVAIRLPNPHHGVAHVDVDRVGKESILSASDIDHDRRGRRRGGSRKAEYRRARHSQKSQRQVATKTSGRGDRE